MSDLKERLRGLYDEWNSPHSSPDGLPTGASVMLEAAAEITRLRAEAENQVQWVRDLADNLIAEEAKTATLRARVAELEEALEWIVGTALTEPSAMVEKARAALAKTGESK